MNSGKVGVLISSMMILAPIFTTKVKEQVSGYDKVISTLYQPA
jgi:hypothetical protein